MWVRTWYERPFGNDEPHIGGYWESELMYDSEDETGLCSALNKFS